MSLNQEPKWGTIEEKDAQGNVVNVKEGLLIGRDNKRVICPADVEELAGSWATYKELAEYFGVKETTFRYHFCENVEKARSLTKIALRKKQIDVAMSGNTSMLIWLGKNILDQSDSPLVEIENILPWPDDRYKVDTTPQEELNKEDKEH
jgi:hypothetical protein